MDEEAQVKAAKNGCEKSTIAIIKRYEKLVHKFANNYRNSARSFAHEDLVQEGNIGILNAIQSFDPGRGAKFFTWAYYNIRAAMVRCGRIERKYPAFALSLEDNPDTIFIEDWSQRIAITPEVPEGMVETLINNCCGGPHTKRAGVVMDRFGLMGRPELTNAECTQKYDITKHHVTRHVYMFKKNVVKKFPELGVYVA